MKAAVYAGATVAVVGAVWWAFQSLWNWLVPELFHGPTLTYWQAAGLLVLFGLLTSGLRSARKP